MRVDLLDYKLDEASIAQAPSADRLAARLLEVPADGDVRHRHVADLPDLIPPGAVVVVNDTRVLPARLLGHKAGTGGKAEILLLRRLGADSPAMERWEAMGRASKGLRVGARIDCDGVIQVEVFERRDELMVVTVSTSAPSVTEALHRIGHMPLPPYIRRADESVDRERYQTVFARVDGAVAAPTAGLHLTDALTRRMTERGCTLATVTLHVGLGTFQPVTAPDLDDHKMHSEAFDIPATTSDAIARARDAGAPVVAIGTTVVRALEAAADASRPGHVAAGSGETAILLQPGYAFRVVDRLFTNFHLPRSTLLALVSAFAGRERILAAYATAQAHGYRFFSYGDAMYLEPAAPPPRVVRTPT